MLEGNLSYLRHREWRFIRVRPFVACGLLSLAGATAAFYAIQGVVNTSNKLAIEALGARVTSEYRGARSLKTILDGLAPWMFVSEVDCSEIELTDPLIDSIAKTSSIRWLSVQGGPRLGRLLDAVAEHPDLWALHIVGGRVNAVTASKMPALSALSSLSCYQVHFESGAFTYVGEMRQLVSLTFSGSRANPEEFLALARLESLSTIDLHNSNVNDQVVPVLSALRNLREIRISNSDCTPAGVSALRSRSDVHVE